MRKLDLEEIKKLSFAVLCAVRDLCDAHGLRYSLTGGTLIGAIRHQGFIPWDDDIDIMMPRPDYDRLIQIVKQTGAEFELLCLETCGENYGYPFAKACYKGTLVQERGIQESNTPLGVYVDIFPVDGAGNHYCTAKLWCGMFQILHGLKLTANWTSYRRSKLRKWYVEPMRYVCYLISKLLGRKWLGRAINCFLHGKEYAKCAYVGRLTGDYGTKEIMPRDFFDRCIEVTFEGENFKAITEYDRFLTILYGNYMMLPPKEKQVTHHEFDAYWVEE